MNLAFKDIRFNLLRFLLTALGVAWMTSSAGMVGLYRGITPMPVDERTAPPGCVQGGRQGPFGRLRHLLHHGSPGGGGSPVWRARAALCSSASSSPVMGRQLRASVTGLDFPKDPGR